MKKRNFKSLQLKKSCVSKLNGGAIPNAGVDVHYDTGNGTITVYPMQTQGAEPGCTWYSELYTACECHPSANQTNCMDCPFEHNTDHDVRAHAAM
jgi:hypothetical protein